MTGALAAGLVAAGVGVTTLALAATVSANDGRLGQARRYLIYVVRVEGNCQSIVEVAFHVVPTAEPHTCIYERCSHTIGL